MIFRSRRTCPNGGKRINFLPGPVSISQKVWATFTRDPISHRADVFVEDFQYTKRLLSDLVQARYVEILLGSGTLANDVIAGQLSLQLGLGVVLANGEFGERLIDHATRFGLSFEVVRAEWGQAFSPEDIRRVVDRHTNVAWIWAVHCETSTGVLNDIDLLKRVCAERTIRLCLDCISSIGTVPVDLSGVYLASGVSGKGLAALPGLSMVFYNHAIQPALKLLPRYLDLGLYAECQGVPFTHSSNLLYALRMALIGLQPEERFKDLIALSWWARARLRELGFQIVTPQAVASPAVITIALPQGTRSEELGNRLDQAGYLLSYRSEYLLKRNWIQICLMGDCSREIIPPLLKQLKIAANGDA